MQLYQAPLEGITGHIYRNALNRIFGGVDKYFAPFISPYEKRIITDKEKIQLCPDNNEGINLVPQILTMDAEGFRALTDWLHSNYGYEEFNLNFGCPSGTVVSKGRGAGSLGNLSSLRAFLDQVFCNLPYRVSIKTRIGLHSLDDWDEILDIYRAYNLEELIIHPRIRDELYKGYPHMDKYDEACHTYEGRLVYNGDINSVADYRALCERHSSDTQAVMLGRGMIANPAIFREIKGGAPATANELQEFLGIITEAYMRDFSGETPVLHKLKEIWTYMGDELVRRYNTDPKLIKQIIKSGHISEYKVCERAVLRGLDH